MILEAPMCPTSQHHAVVWRQRVPPSRALAPEFLIDTAAEPISDAVDRIVALAWAWHAEKWPQESGDLQENRMKKIEAIIRTFKLDPVKDALVSLGVGGMTLSDVRGFGRQPARVDFYEDVEYTIDLLPRVKVEVVVPDDLVEKALSAIVIAARTGSVGDGKILVLPILQSIRIRTGEQETQAL
jgi:nitrogen regulatory protein P-II 1